MELKLDEGTGNTIVIFGSSKSGKSTKLMELYQKYFSKYVCTLFAGNPQISLYQSYPDIILVDGFPSFGNDYIELEKTINKNTDNAYKFLNMFDDILNVRHKNLINEGIISMRNSNISTIVCLQNIKLFSRASRDNVNNIMFFSWNSDESIEDTLKIFLSSFFKRLGVSSKEDMINLYRQLTKNHNYLYLHPSSGYFYSSLKGVLFNSHDQ
jgi:hypothetical protein